MAAPSREMPFHEFCNFLNSVRGKGYEDMRTRKHILSRFFRQIKSASDGEEDFQNRSKEIISLLLSDSNEARKLDLGETKLSQLVCKVVDMPNIGQRVKGQGIMALKLAEEVISRFGGVESNMTVGDVCDRLDIIAQGNSTKKAKEVEYFVQNCSKNELIWLFNIMMRNAEAFLGVNRKIILECITPEASEIWKNTRDLGRLTSRPADVLEPDYFLGVNFCPQLLARLSLETINEQIKLNLQGGFYMEIKFDGEHVLMHKKGTSYKWYTRNGKDFTEHYGSHHKEKLAEQIHPVFKNSVEECILDCELMHYDEKRGCLIRHLEKAADGVTLSYQNPQPGHRIVVVVFDLLYFGGKVRGEDFQEDLMQVPLSDRVQIMNDRLLKRNEEHNIYIPDRSEGTTEDDIREFYEAATKVGEEGIAVKRKDSLYCLGERAKRNGWFKLKEMFDMDLVIVGYVPAKNDKGNAFLLAAWDDGNVDGRDLHVICKSYAGLKEIERDNIMDDARSGGSLLKEAPDCLHGWAGNKNNLYFRPENYVVVEAKAFGVRNDSLVDVVMRRIRSDKSICKEDIDDYRTIKKHQPGMNDIKAHMELEATTSSEDFKAKRITKREIFEEASAPSSKKPNTETETPLTNRTVCVLQAFDEKLRKKCWSILEGFGAKVIANPNETMDFIVAPSEKHMKVKTAIKKGTHNVVKGDWLMRCEEAGIVLSWKPSEILVEVPGSFSIE